MNAVYSWSLPEAALYITPDFFHNGEYRHLLVNRIAVLVEELT